MTQNTNTATKTAPAWVKTLKDNPTILHPRITRNDEGYWENGDGINYTSRELAERAART